MWYQSKVKYETVVEGRTKTITESYLHEAVNFGEVEKHCYENLKTRIKHPNVDAIAKANVGEVVFYAGTSDSSYVADAFYRVAITWSDDKSAFLVPAKDAEQAIERALKAHGVAQVGDVKEVSRTDILAVWHPHNELWRGDWWNRMELLAELGKKSWDIDQTEIFNEDGTATTGNREESDPCGPCGPCRAGRGRV